MTLSSTPSQPSAILRFHAHWRAFALLVTAIARQLLRLERAGAGDVRARAAALEGCALYAMAEINAAIAETRASGGALTRAETGALAHLTVIAVMLHCLALFLARLIARQPRGSFGLAPRPVWASAMGAPAHVPYLDSS